MKNKMERNSLLLKFMTLFAILLMLFWLVVYAVQLSLVCSVLQMIKWCLASQEIGGRLIHNVDELIILLF